LCLEGHTTHNAQSPALVALIFFSIRTMARITVEDCLQNVDNLFQLVILAAQRARRLANGAEPTVAWENDKPTVVALREIAAGNVTLDMLREPEPPAEPAIPELEAQSSFRAPQFGLGD
jgi:DNA-directed RNA polymerase subunit omega